MKKLLCATLAACALAAGAAMAQGGAIALEGAPYVLEGTEVRTVRARELGRDYQIYVSLPASYAKSGRSYPVVFVTDAPYTFPLARAIAWRAGHKGRAIGEFILVGLSYANGETAEYSRRRDYTPGPTADTDVTSDMPGREPKFGEAAAYARYLANDVFPMVAKHYRADMNRKTYIGHTFGALLGLDMLFSERPLFEQYVLGSPSLWFGRRMMVEREKAYAATHKDLRAAVFIAAGDSGNRKDEEALRDAKALLAALKSRNYPNLRLAGAVIHDEDQMTAPPAIITRGLRWAVPGSE